MPDNEQVDHDLPLQGHQVKIHHLLPPSITAMKDTVRRKAQFVKGFAINLGW
jgi:hypothetical protein